MGSLLSLYLSVYLVLSCMAFPNCKQDRECDIDNSKANTIFGAILCGDLVQNNDGISYSFARTQYASVSRPENVMPSMIVFAECDSDIRMTLQYARSCDYKVVIRSGGHQYSGLSSCNLSIHKCIQLDLSRYNKIEYNEKLNELTIGAGTKIVYINNFLTEKGLFVPHGDCKNVCIGGHIQGGGQGHIHNQFGLLSDHAVGFDIFLANGELIHVRKPSNWQTSNKQMKQHQNMNDKLHQFNDILYYGVLGGGHGSFGVIKNVLLSPLRDKDYETKSLFYECDWLFNAQILYNLLVVMQQIYTENADFNRVNVDYGFYIRSHQKRIKLLGSFVSTSGANFNTTYFDRFIAAANAIQNVKCEPMFMSPSRYLQSALVDHVYDLQTFENRLQVSPLLLSDGFIAAYVERMSLLQLPMYDGINIYSDITFAGGNFVLNDPDPQEQRTAVGGKTANLQVNTDVFYDENINQNAKEITKQWIKDTWHRLMNTETFGFGTIDVRAKDASFGNVNMTEVWPFYYGGNNEFYAGLRQIKTTLDPNDLFSNTFTLKPYIDNN